MRQKGFTLIEAIVATAVFAFIVSSIVGVYLAALRIDRKTRAQRAVVQNARYITEFLAKEVRNGRIDYSGANSCTLSSTTLCIINQAGDFERIFYSNSTDLGFVKNGQATNLNSTGAKVTKLLFFVKPTGDPFTPAKTFNQQPIVTMVMELTSTAYQRVNDVAKVDVQTSFSPRLYPSR